MKNDIKMIQDVQIFQNDINYRYKQSKWDTLSSLPVNGYSINQRSDGCRH